ncbi:hypothetical protein V6N13_146626 [Hibiscus sabdariffa]|uniref:Enhanced disease resistance 4-like N-terminal domain-containing protein n=1 Tax=Hibiscus sabdariffa TaxID=183260 RepID=A0ABR2TT77_9ROSI
MAESNKVRLVRCPKCENLLPELAGYSVYQCGGCGAVLREPFAYPVEHDMTRHGMYPPMHNPNHIPAYGDPFGSKMLGRAPHRFPGEYQQPPHPYFSGQYMESNQDPFMPYPRSSVLHQVRWFIIPTPIPWFVGPRRSQVR